MLRDFDVNCALKITFMLCAVILLSGLMLTSSSTSAETTSANASVIVPASCNFTSTINTPHTTEIPASQYKDNIGKTTFKVTCNDSGGFSIYAVGNSNNEYGNNKLLASIGNQLSPTYDIVTGTSTSGNTSNWAMKLTAVSNTYTPTIETDTNGSFSSYHIVPTTYTKVASFSSKTDDTVGASIEATYASYIASDQPAGNYNGKVKYTMVHPATETPAQPQVTQSGKICYYANASDAVGTMGCQTIPTSGTVTDGVSNTSATLLASNFSRTGYGFAGWSDAYDYTSNSDAHFYGPQETITYENGQYVGEGKGLSLYAVWVKSEGNLQDTNKVASVCSNLTAGATNLDSVSAFTDQRDNNTYAIAKLADGNCWMIENLRLQNTGADNTNGSLAQGYGGQFAGLAAPETAWANNITTANSLYSTDGADSTINIGTSNAGYRFPRYNNINTPTNAADRPQNPTSNTFANNSTTVGMYSYGNYYTWHAAIANTTAYTSNNTSATNTSICPTGWHLPKGGNNQNTANNEFLAFSEALIGAKPANYDSQTYPYYTGTPEGTDASNKLRAYPNNFVYSGYVFSGSVDNRGSYGYYWSSTARSSSDAYYLYLYSSSVYPGTNVINKYYGWTVRCVANF